MSDNIFVTVQEEDLNSAVATIYNPIALARIEDIGNVDSQAVINGSILVYKTTTNKWTATTMLDAQNMEGGEY